MPRRTGCSRRGFSLLEVLIALVVLVAGAMALAGAASGMAASVGLGRRWLAMAEAAEAELVRLDRDYRLARPVCIPPGSGARFTADGVALDWLVSGDSVLARVRIVARAMTSRRIISDSVVTTLSCR